MGSRTVRQVVQLALTYRSYCIMAKTHFKSRCLDYPRTNEIKRFPVPDDKVSWEVQFEDYQPTEYTAPSLLKKPVWADIDFKAEPETKVEWNEIDGTVDRRSYEGKYQVSEGVPLNPVGRTGLCLRGLLGRWGPNHAADPVVTRWKRNKEGQVVKHEESEKPILQFIAVQRRDNGEWAIPGGMVDTGELVSVTLKREFSEEAMNALELPPDELKDVENKIAALFKKGYEVYRGYVDDPRNTDNSWMETVAVNFHDETGGSVGRFNLHAGDDAIGVRWTDIDHNLKLFASHIEFLEKVIERHKAHW